MDNVKGTWQTFAEPELRHILTQVYEGIVSVEEGVQTLLESLEPVGSKF